MAKIKTQGRDRPWLPDDRRNDDRLKKFFSTEPPTLGWLLMEAWDDANVGISFGLGAIVAARKSDAEKTDDVRMSRWMLDIGNRILETPTGRDAKAGELTREQLLDAAYDRVVAAGNDALILSSERESLQTESLRRTAAPLRRLIDEFNKEVATLAVSDVPSAGYLRGVVSELQKLAGADDADSLVNHEGITEAEKRVETVQQWCRVADAIASELVAAFPTLADNREGLARKVHQEMEKRSKGGDHSVRKRGGVLVPTVETIKRRGLPNYGQYGEK